MLTYHKTTEEEKYRITAWQYDGAYAIYNSDAYGNQKARGVGFANPKNNFYSFYDGAALVASSISMRRRRRSSSASEQTRPAAARGTASR